MRVTPVILGLAAILGAFPVNAAASPDWNYIEGSYITSEFDTDDDRNNVDVDGFEIAGAFQFFQD